MTYDSGAVETHYLYAYGPGNRRLLTFDAQTTERVLTLRDLSGQWPAPTKSVRQVMRNWRE